VLPTRDKERREKLYQKVVDLYENALLGEEAEMGLDRLDLNAILDSQRAMISILQGIVALREITVDATKKQALRTTVSSILKLECFQGMSFSRLSSTAKETLPRAGWLRS
jgi:hypothetical protein